jgi:hypothetical protein
MEKGKQPAIKNLKVHFQIVELSSSKNNPPTVPQSFIRMRGKWLERLGFLPGTPIKVKCQKKKLVITVDE